MSDGTRVDVTGSATWASSHPSILSVSAQGRVTGLGAGLCSVTATFRGITARVEVQVTGAPVIESLRIAGGAQVRLGHGLQLRAIVRYSDGSEKDVTDLVDWSCSNSLLASITKGCMALAREQ
jgi:trimeric autotransporter adhesin